jgi:hypothetical protein
MRFLFVLFGRSRGYECGVQHGLDTENPKENSKMAVPELMESQI